MVYRLDAGLDLVNDDVAGKQFVGLPGHVERAVDHPRVAGPEHVVRVAVGVDPFVERLGGRELDRHAEARVGERLADDLDGRLVVGLDPRSLGADVR